AGVAEIETFGRAAEPLLRAVDPRAQGDRLRLERLHRSSGRRKRGELAVKVFLDAQLVDDEVAGGGRSELDGAAQFAVAGVDSRGAPEVDVAQKHARTLLLRLDAHDVAAGVAELLALVPDLEHAALRVPRGFPKQVGRGGGELLAVLEQPRFGARGESKLAHRARRAARVGEYGDAQRGRRRR